MNWVPLTRSQIIGRAQSGFGTGLGRIPYSQDTTYNGYRTDCSGYVSRCLELPVPGFNTVDLVSSGTLRYLGGADSIVQGDLGGDLGPGTEGDNGHVWVFDRWLNNVPFDSRMYIYEQFGGSIGPQHTLRSWPYPDTCAAYRYAGLASPTIPVPLPTVQRYGVSDMFIAHVINNPAMYLVYPDGTARHIQDPDSLTGLESVLGKPVAMTTKDFAALLKVVPV